MIEQVVIRDRRAPRKWVWLHGMFGGVDDVLPLAEFLPHQDDVEAWVFPGHGRPRSIPGFAVVVGELTRLLNEEIAEVMLVGYSMGGRFALATATKKNSSLVGTVVLSAAAGIASEKDRLHRAFWDEQWASRLEHQPGDVVHREWLEQALFSTLNKTTKWELLQRRKTLESISVASAMRRFGQGMQPPLHNRLGEIGRPVYLVSGTLDKKYADAQKEVGALISSAELGFVQGAGHAVHLEEPAALGALLSEFSERCFSHVSLQKPFISRVSS
ncbi:MAG: alpha/beta fold hydrolase [Deltaproteobacteria bacterium]|nr:alpha/beta fold hydrolase [Deltaproteobacteria bacterium]